MASKRGIKYFPGGVEDLNKEYPESIGFSRFPGTAVNLKKCFLKQDTTKSIAILDEGRHYMMVTEKDGIDYVVYSGAGEVTSSRKVDVWGKNKNAGIEKRINTILGACYANPEFDA